MIPKHLAGLIRVFKGCRFEVVTTSVTDASGRRRQRDIVLHPGAVVILPLLDEQTMVLIRNERVAVGQTLWEIPAGTLEPDETPLACAERELIEETGYRAASMEPMLQMFPSPGVMSEQMHLFIARDLHAVGQALDEGETITVHPTPLAVSIEMMRRGEICDGKTLTALLYYMQFVAGR